MIDLELDLRALGDHIDYPEAPGLVATVTARIGEPGRRRERGVPLLRRWAVAVAVVVLLATAVATLVPAVRDQVAAWLGIGGVEVEEVEQIPEGLGLGIDLGEPVTIAAAEAAGGFPLLLPVDLGPPDLVFLVDDGRAVSLVWAAGDGLPATDAGIGAILTEFRGETGPFISKLIGPDSELTPAAVGSSPAYWIEGGPHPVIYLDPQGKDREDRGRLAGNTLLWERDGLTLRLESGLDREAAIAVAESVG